MLGPLAQDFMISKHVANQSSPQRGLVWKPVFFLHFCPNPLSLAWHRNLFQELRRSGTENKDNKEPVPTGWDWPTALPALRPEELAKAPTAQAGAACT